MSGRVGVPPRTPTSPLCANGLLELLALGGVAAANGASQVSAIVVKGISEADVRGGIGLQDVRLMPRGDTVRFGQQMVDVAPSDISVNSVRRTAPASD